MQATNARCATSDEAEQPPTNSSAMARRHHAWAAASAALLLAGTASAFVLPAARSSGGADLSIGRRQPSSSSRRFMIPPPPPPGPSSSSTLEGPATTTTTVATPEPGVAAAAAPGGLSLMRPQVDLLPKAEELFGTPPAKTGTDFLPSETLARAQKGSFLEKIKLKKDGSVMWREVHELAALLRSGQYTWEELDLATDSDDIDQRLKYAGIFHRRKRTPGRFMMRMRIPNGLLTSEQLFFIAEAMAKYGDDYEAVVDITTRQNLQLRGLKLEDTSELITGLVERGLGCYSSGLDNVRNVVGSPLAGIDPLEEFDTRQICKDINDMVTNRNLGNPEWANLPRKFNIAVSGSRDDYAHTHINDIGLQAVRHTETGEVGFNVVLGGYFSTKRAATSVELGLWVPPSQVLNLCYSILRIFRDHGNRKDRQKARLLWLIEEWGLDAFRQAVLEEMQTNAAYGVGAGQPLPVDKEQHHAEPPFERRDYLGVHPQKQPGHSWVGLHVPVGRFRAFDIHELGRLAERYSGGELRLTVEQNVIFPNVQDADVPALLADPFVAGGRFKIDPGPLARGLVACTGAQFCGVGLVETKNRAIDLVAKLEAAYDIPQTVRIHFSGCPNSCGQSQVADIGLMGAPAKKDGKAVEGVDVFLGGAVGEEAALGDKFLKNVPMGENDADVIASLGEILVEHFGAVKK